nr:hypothetical protein [uncultured Prevotella sp.]
MGFWRTPDFNAFNIHHCPARLARSRILKPQEESSEISEKCSETSPTGDNMKSET